MTNRNVVTRFAPSPTGFLHIGGARTALFNWAFARKHGGTFILRIEDTDRARSTPESTRGIIEDLKWLGLDWDEGPDAGTANPYTAQTGHYGPYFQSQRLEQYRQQAVKLMQDGRAYKCFKTPEELAVDREEARQLRRPYKYDRTQAISLTPDTITRYEREGRPCVVRFRMPDTDITVRDSVLGNVTVKAAELEDFIIVKSDGYPTFHLANVVDDAAMNVTHVLRAQEHLMNTPKHVALQEALGFDTPRYAHMPLIFNPDGSKMSKRDKAKAARQGAKAYLKEHGNDTAQLARKAGSLGANEIEAFVNKKTDDTTIAALLADALGVELPEIDVHDFKQSGYLPETALNYIALLGWSPGNNVERFDLDFLVEQFDLGRIGKANARFDRAKLLAFNTESIAKLPPEVFLKHLAAHDAEFHHRAYLEKLGKQNFTVFAESYRPRCRTLQEPFVNGRFFIVADDAFDYQPDAVKKNLQKDNGEGFGVLQDLRPLLADCQPWSAAQLEIVVKQYAEDKSLGLGKVAQPLRVAVSGSTVSPPIYDTLAILGQAATLARIDRCMELAATQPQQPQTQGH